MVNPSLEIRTVYAAVELDIALDAALKKHMAELREMEQKKHALQQMSKQRQFGPSDEFATFKIIKNAKESIIMLKRLTYSAVDDIMFALLPVGLAFSSIYGDHDSIRRLSHRGVCMRGIINISRAYLDVVREYAELYAFLDSEKDESYATTTNTGAIFMVMDSRESVTGINPNVKSISLDEPVVALWTDDPVYAKNLSATFELLWEKAIPAQRIEELLKEGPL